MDRGALKSTFGVAEEARDSLPVENNGLKPTNEELTERFTYCSRKLAKKGIDALPDSLSGKYIRAALTVQNKLSCWARNKSLNVISRWKLKKDYGPGRAEILSENGIVTNSGLTVIPKCPIVWTKSEEF